MLSKKQMNNISILSLGIGLLATIVAPPAASAIFVFASTAAISAVALSFMTAISNIMPNNIFNHQSTHANNNNNAGWIFRGTRRPTVIPVPDIRTTVNALRDHSVLTSAYVVPYESAPKPAGKTVRFLNPETTATGTKIPGNATNIQRVITTKDGVSRQNKKTTTILQQPVVTSMGTKIPKNATNIKRTITPILRDRSGSSHEALPTTNHIGKNVIITNSRSYTPQASHRSVQRGHANHPTTSHDVQTGNGLSGKVIIRTRRA